MRLDCAHKASKGVLSGRTARVHLGIVARLHLSIAHRHTVLWELAKDRDAVGQALVADLECEYLSQFACSQHVLIAQNLS